jgi:exonuclease SbcC
VKLQGFLCYKEAQQVDFDGSSLWMLAGVNGSGKSSVFDAVTYALFGYHRGGSQHADELINKDSDGLLVEFDFTLDGHHYRIKRSLRRKARGGTTSTQQVLRRQANGDGHEDWIAVEGTGQRREFEAWVNDHIGLTYETFTSSVLLLQGKAEKLLDSTAKGRFEVLAGIVDLDRYERLHEQADKQRKNLKDRVESLGNRLAALPEVQAAQLAEAEDAIATAEAARQQAQSEVARWQELEFQARQWMDLQGRLSEVAQRWQQAQQLLGEASAIERDASRMKELKEVLPRLQTIAEQRARIRDAETKTLDLIVQKEKVGEQLGESDHSLGQTQQKRKVLQNRIAQDEQRQREVAVQLREATALREKLKEHERQDLELQGLQAEKKRLPPDPAALLAQLREKHDHLVSSSQAVATLTRLQARREELRQTQAREQVALHARQAVQVRGEKAAAEVERLKPRAEEATQARQKDDEQATEARTLAQQARQQRDELNQLDGAKLCRHCGQQLTKGHLEEEKRRRSATLAAAEERAQKASAEQQAARSAEKELREQLARVEKDRLDAREDYRECRTQAEQARQEVERLKGECLQSHQELSEPYRTRVSPTPPADWLTTTYPAAADLADLRKDAAELADIRQRLSEAEKMQARWNTLQGQEKTLLQALTRLQAELPANRQSVHDNYARLEAESRTLEGDLTAQRKEAAETQEQLDRLGRERERAQKQLADIQGRLNTEEATRQNCLQIVARQQKDLPLAWQTLSERIGLADRNRWEKEREDLEKNQTEDRAVKLQQARLGVQAMERERAELEKQVATYPAEACQEPAQVQALLHAARQKQGEREEELSQARQCQALLAGQRKQRQELGQARLQADQELAHAKLLAELLGRERLQLFLVRQAERQVIDHANAVLDRLSGGQLYLRLCGNADGEGASAKALDLEVVNRVTGEKPINVAFLSGSQKFRVAVSLALGIGQYASRQHRPIESVIIDEGFGCLDRQGRQVMIQELQNLRGQLRCILLVSHQEEFAEAFNDGYRFELTNGATKVTRIPK